MLSGLVVLSVVVIKIAVILLSASVVQDLQELCRGRGLSVSYRLKSDLVDRLNVADSEDYPDVFETTGANKSVDTTTGSTTTNVGYSEAEDSVIQNLDSTIVNGGDDPHDPNQNGNGSDNGSHSVDEDSDSDDMGITFKDVADALPKFGGAPGESVVEWETEYKATASTSNWSEVQMYVFARKIMIDEAKMFMEYKKSAINNLETLVTALKQEFRDQTPTLDIHEMLAARKWKHMSNIFTQ